MKISYKKLFKIIWIIIFIFIILPCSFFILNVSAQQQQGLEIDYPDIVDIDPPSRRPTFLPNYIRYAYRFAVAIGGFITLGAIIAGGLGYLTSAGNPSKMSDAKNQIIMGVVGLIIILGAFVLLNEISPDLVALEAPGIHLLQLRGIVIYSDDDCGNGSNGTPGIFAPLPATTTFEKIEGTKSINPSFNVSSFYLNSFAPDLIGVMFYDNESCEGRALFSHSPGNSPICISQNIENVQCVKLLWYMPGVFVFSYPNGNPENPSGTQAWAHFKMDSDLPSGISDKVESIAFVKDNERHVHYGAILHRDTGPRYINKNWAHLYLPNRSAPTSTFPVGGAYHGGSTRPRSITVFELNPSADGSKEITICMNKDCDPQPDDTGVDQDASTTTTWNMLQTIPSPPARQDWDVVRGVIFREPANTNQWLPWWPDGRRIVVCQPGSAFITDARALCYNGISAVEVEHGANYLIILYNLTNVRTWPGTWNYGSWALGYSSAQSMTLDGTIRWLGAHHNFNDATGAMLVIKIRK